MPGVSHSPKQTVQQTTQQPELRDEDRDLQDTVGNDALQRRLDGGERDRDLGLLGSLEVSGVLNRDSDGPGIDNKKKTGPTDTSKAGKQVLRAATTALAITRRANKSGSISGARLDSLVAQLRIIAGSSSDVIDKALTDKLAIALDTALKALHNGFMSGGRNDTPKVRYPKGAKTTHRDFNEVSSQAQEKLNVD